MAVEERQYKVPCIFSKLQNGFRDAAKGCINPELAGNPGSSSAQTCIRVDVPGSKSITNRALLLATLAEGKSVLFGTLFSDDSRHFLKCIQELGFETCVDEENKVIEVTGLGGAVPKAEASIYVGSAGTAARFLSAYLGVSHGTYHLDASEQMRRRPMAPLLHSLRSLGCEVSCENNEGFFPFTLRSDGFKTDDITVDIDSSSQFLSALLIAAALADKDMKIRLRGSHGMAYIRMTEKMMEQFGVGVEQKRLCQAKPHCGEVESGCYCNPSQDSNLYYQIPAGQKYRAREYQVEPDVSAACYFYAMAPLLGISVQVKHVHFDSLQGDVAFLCVLEQMGCRVEEQADGILVSGNPDGTYHGVEADLASFSDQAITLAALAPFADSPTVIKGIGHIRLQESDRMAAIVTELGKLGIICEMGEDDIKIYPGTPGSGLVDTYEDHRMAMGFSLIGLRAEGIVIDNPACCRKTFENYFETLEAVVGKLLTK